MKETHEAVIQLSAISQQGLQMFSQFLRKQQLEKSPLEILFESLDAALYLQAKNLICFCNEEIVKSMTPQNCDLVEDFYTKFNLLNEISVVQRYRREHIMEYSETTEYLQLNFDEICSLLDSTYLNVPSELSVWKLVLKWLKSNRDEIDRLCPSGKTEDLVPVYKKLLGVVRFLSIPPRQLKSLEKSQSVDQFKLSETAGFLSASKESVRAAVKYHKNPALSVCDSAFRTDIRNPVKILLTFGGFTESEAASRVVQHMAWTQPGEEGEDDGRCTLSRESKWRLPTPLCENGTCVLNNILYVAGGQTKYQEDGRYTTNKVYRFDPHLCSWKELAPMLKKRSLFYLGVGQGSKLYAVSGWQVEHDLNGPTPTVEAYDIATNTWQYVKPLDAAMGEHSGCTLNGELYISGGFKGPFLGHLDKLWRYAEERDDWVTLAPMLHARSYHAMAATVDSILVAGGVNYIGDDNFEDVLSCELYNPTSNQWSVVHTSLPRPASCMSCVYVTGRLYLYGGHSFAEDTDHDQVMVLDCVNWTWSERALKSQTSYFTAVVIDVPKYHLYTNK